MKLLTKIATLALALAIVAASGVTAFAATESAKAQLGSPKAAYNVNAQSKFEQGERPEMTEEQKAEMIAKAKEMLDSQLADGKITQEQYEQAITDLNNGKMAGFGRGMEQGERPKMTEEQKAEMIAKVKETLDSQLADGKITKEQYEQAITDLNNGKMVEFGRGMEQGERPKMTDGQKTEMIANMKEMLDSQLADGKITQEQYEQAITDLSNGKMVGLGRGMNTQRKEK